MLDDTTGKCGPERDWKCFLNDGISAGWSTSRTSLRELERILSQKSDKALKHSCAQISTGTLKIPVPNAGTAILDNFCLSAHLHTFRKAL